MKPAKIGSWLFRIVAALILLQTLYFKFSGQPESVELFTKLGVEPYGRIGAGIMELLAAILLLVPRTSFIGAVVGLGIISGALMSHFTLIGIESNGDGGQLFILALIVFISCIMIASIERKQGRALLKRFQRKSISPGR
jgi:putative oxidoreductase